MTVVKVIENIDGSAEDVFSILGDFAGVETGGPITSVEIEGEGVGAVRTINTVNGRVIERLDEYDENLMTFSYSIINDDCPLPVAGYSSKVEVISNGESCTVSWIGTFEPKGADEETTSRIINGIYTGGIQRARSKLGDLQDFADYKVGFDNQPLHKTLGITVVSRSKGRGKIVLLKDENTPGGIGGSVHAGILAAMVDIVMLVAVLTEKKENQTPAGTADLSINYLRQTHGKHIYAEAKVVKIGRQLATVHVEITDDEGTLCAFGQTLYAFRAA